MLINEKQLFTVAKDMNKHFKLGFPEDNQYDNVNLEDLEYMLLEDCVQCLIEPQLDLDTQTWNFYARNGNKVANKKIGGMFSTLEVKAEKKKRTHVSKVSFSSFPKLMIKFLIEASPSGVTESDFVQQAKMLFPSMEMKQILHKWRYYVVCYYWKKFYKVNLVRVEKGRYRIIWEGNSLVYYLKTLFPPSLSPKQKSKKNMIWAKKKKSAALKEEKRLKREHKLKLKLQKEFEKRQSNAIV